MGVGGSPNKKAGLSPNYPRMKVTSEKTMLKHTEPPLSFLVPYSNINKH